MSRFSKGNQVRGAEHRSICNFTRNCMIIACICWFFFLFALKYAFLEIFQKPPGGLFIAAR